MIKSMELESPFSCLNRAYATEIIFVLLARDSAAPVAIRAWVDERIRIGKNKLDDPEIQEALQCADSMERQQRGPSRMSAREG